MSAKTVPTCLTNQPACLAKKQRPFDYDYLPLEQLFAPQFCRDLLKDADSTISHQNVRKYPNGITCKPSVVQSEMTIHGLWPNYNDGYASCYKVSASIDNRPYNAPDFAKNQPELLKEMTKKWVDPTQVTTYDTLCEIYNHEFQKHGLCYGTSGNDYVNPKKIQVLCSSVDGKNQLLAIHSCYAKQPAEGTVGPFTPIDCAATTKTAALAPCTSVSPIKLLPYQAPV